MALHVSGVVNSGMNISWRLCCSVAEIPLYAGQAKAFLPLLPPETGRGVWGMALRESPQGRSSSSFRIQHTENL